MTFKGKGPFSLTSTQVSNQRTRLPQSQKKKKKKEKEKEKIQSNSNDVDINSSTKQSLTCKGVKSGRCDLTVTALTPAKILQNKFEFYLITSYLYLGKKYETTSQCALAFLQIYLQMKQDWVSENLDKLCFIFLGCMAYAV